MTHSSTRVEFGNFGKLRKLLVNLYPTTWILHNPLHSKHASETHQSLN